MYAQTFAFISASFVLLTLARLGLIVWQRQRVRASGKALSIFIGGLRIDALLITLFAALPLLLAPWVGAHPVAQTITGGWLLLGWLLICLLEFSTPQFIREYDTRPNRLYLVYLKYPKEVFTMLWRGYCGVLIATLATMAVMTWLGSWLWMRAPHWNWPGQALANIGASSLLSLAATLLSVLLIRGTLKHRPINPSSVACCGDALVNALALNSLYSVLYAAYSLKHERSSADVYGTLPEAQVHDYVRQCAGLPPRPTLYSTPDATQHITQSATPPQPPDDIPTLHVQQATYTPPRPRHVVLIVEESLGAQFVGHLHGGVHTHHAPATLTPELDKLAEQAWTFTRAYATGTRSVRGLEALAAGFPPCYAEAALKLPGAQARFFTLAQLLKPQGWRTCFVYGGEAHFDNMQGFFLGNGFEELHDRNTFENPAFVGTWGVSDEDMFARVHALLDGAQQPCLILAFSVSNHSPWEYPAGRIQPQGEPRTVHNTVRYADWALGRFFDRARAASYWDDTVFLVAADHDARAGGQAHVPLKHFHIPALILGGSIAPKRDDRIVSQIDFPATLLSLAGVSGSHPMIGHDLTRPHTGGRAMMQYGEHYGYLDGDVLTVLQPYQHAVQFRHQAPDRYLPMALDAQLARRALAHALWPNLVYQQQCYTLPHLRLRGSAPESRP